MHNKIVFFDIDGTLLDHDKQLPVSTKEAIATLQQNGVYTAIATGRAPFMFSGLREELGIDSFVSFNGQYVVFEGEPIVWNALPPNTLKTLTEHAKELGHPLVYLSDHTMRASVAEHKKITSAMGSLQFEHPEMGPTYYEEDPIYQALLFCDEKEEEVYWNEYPELHFIRWHEHSMDVLPKGGSKARGIQEMIKKLGFRMEDVYAFGDGLNDLEMLEAVGHGVAMGNAHEKAKRCADYVTDDVDKDGIVKGLRELGLLK
ncbi:Cof-type HAD-IIB family hydrolase [Bacillus fonticola]|uniref:Cof-type HAD-IIB family hydrolase n=1 Tax=Bacillus fonticola TaxID=2728853 RepID=UPI0014757578|nr:Cof-type HAD-IIB family hydrolase [Bacillus fonticola]